MEKELIIKDKNIIYIGGNQNWFLPLGYKDISKYGCGIVAVCNFLLCFFRSEYRSGYEISKDTFISFVMSIYKKYLCILNNVFIKGLTGFALANGINRYFSEYTQAVCSLLAQAIHTVPTGSCGVPPEGPANPVTAIA